MSKFVEEVGKGTYHVPSDMETGCNAKTAEKFRVPQGMTGMTTKTRILPNLGPQSEAWLAEIGLTQTEEIRALGAVETYARLRFRFGNKINRNMLFALAAGLAGIHWTALAPEHKAELDQLARERLAESGS